jgi:hypothetical protein
LLKIACLVAVCLAEIVGGNESGRFILSLATKAVLQGSVIDLNIADTLYLINALLLLLKFIKNGIFESILNSINLHIFHPFSTDNYYNVLSIEYFKPRVPHPVM